MLGCATLVGLVATSLSGADAQHLRALHVDALGMHADRVRLRIGEVFHLAIHAHVRENVTALDELVVPDIGTMQNDGDERHVTHSTGGTDVVETLTLEPTVPGPFTFAGAYLDAIDGRNGRPSRFRSNPVRVVVDPRGPLAAVTGGGMERAFIAAGELLAALAAAIMLILLVRRRRPRPPVRIGAPPPPVAPPRTVRDEVGAALRAYRAAPQTASLLRLRAALFTAAGAAPGSTLRDALAGTQDGGLRAALFAAERTAFGPAAVRDAASAELVGAVEVWLR